MQYFSAKIVHYLDTFSSLFLFINLTFQVNKKEANRFFFTIHSLTILVLIRTSDQHVDYLAILSP